ncbi:carbonic anhydrase [Sphingomonas sp. HDW15A]|uniref:carbonic anhydrase n=1 Tax=Sphingomonas sp. HDW15A TaxID=2714942 RepID=UPI00140D8BFB|nr:carbonic anhydrase [Sphingomonas sp. HDW15A]QIK96731.1 carbonic anhydrase [Sphingomonas sp. HDW15A]
MSVLSTDRRTFMGLGAAATAAVATSAAASSAAPAGPPKTSLTADEALARLIRANEAFVADRAPSSDISTKRRLELAKGQAPFAALVGCADSRVGPEHLFGAGLGELFIVRTAGNYVDDAGYGSLAYAVAALGVPLIVVLGHERCGAVDAAAKLVLNNEQLPSSLTRMVQPILPAVVDARATLGGKDLLDHSIHMNVRHVARTLRETTDALLGKPIAEGKLKVVGAYYDLDTGRVDFFDRG